MTGKEFVKLRKEIVLNSLYISDYENSFNIDPQTVCSFFDGYMEYLQELEREDGESLDIDEFFERYDTTENLLEWYASFEIDPLQIPSED